MSTYVFTKNPAATLDYTINWEPWLCDDTLVSSDWTAPSDITIVSSSFTATTATIWVSGGESDTNYILTNNITTAGGRTEVGYVTLIIKSSNNLGYLIPYVRLKIGDVNSASYRYTDEWIHSSLVLSISTLGRWMNYKYLLDNDNNIYRNPNVTFIFAEPPIVEMADNSLIVLMAAYVLLEGSLQNSAYDIASWRDAEISFSNLESARTRNDILSKLWDELTSALLPPVKRLAFSKKQSLPGYLNNEYEIGNMK